MRKLQLDRIRLKLERLYRISSSVEFLDMHAALVCLDACVHKHQAFKEEDVRLIRRALSNPLAHKAAAVFETAVESGKLKLADYLEIFQALLHLIEIYDIK